MKLRKNTLSFFFTVLMSVSAICIQAQTGDDSEVKRDFFNTPYMRFGGYGLVLYQHNDLDKMHDIFPRLVFLSAEGKIGDKWRYFILTEFTNPRLFEYYGEWTPADYFNLRAGQFKVPFSFENEISPTQLEGIYNTRTVNNLAGMLGDVGVNNGGGRDIGVQASGSFWEVNGLKLFNYKVGFFQGTGINIRENNNRKDFAGIVTLSPVKGLRLGYSTYFGESVYTLSGDSVAKSHVRNRWALSAEYTSDRFYARSEWINGNDAGNQKFGVYGTALWYFIPKKLNAFGRVDFYSENEITDFTTGISYYFYKNCRLQFNYTFSNFSGYFAGTFPRNNIAGQLQFVF